MIERVIGNAGMQDTQVIEPIPAQQTSHSHLSIRTEQIVHNVGLNSTNWIGSLNALQLINAAHAQHSSLLTTKGSGVTTVADYHTGPPARPIVHNGNSIQNPIDPAQIPAIAPSDSDGQTVKGWRNNANWRRFDRALITERDFHDASIGSNGTSYDNFVREDEAGRTTLRGATLDVQAGAEEIYRQMISQDPGLKNEPLTFVMTGSRISVGNSHQFPHPQTQFWHEVIGSHQIWMSATVTVSPSDDPNGPPHLSMRMTLHAEKRFVLEDDSVDDFRVEADSSSFATLERDVSWIAGRPEDAVSKRVKNYRRV